MKKFSTIYCLPYFDARLVCVPEALAVLPREVPLHHVLGGRVRADQEVVVVARVHRVVRAPAIKGRRSQWINLIVSGSFLWIFVVLMLTSSFRLVALMSM